jgi:predicted amidohydrolase
MIIHLVQLDILWEDKTANQERVAQLLQENPPAPGSLVVLPEMFSTGFSVNLPVTAQLGERADEVFLAKQAIRHQCAIMGGVVSPADQGQSRNESVTFSPDGRILGRYAKMQPFTLGGEHMCHMEGSEVITFPYQEFTVAPLICYDLRFPELFRDAVKKGADLFVVIASWPVKRYHHWLTLLQARAIENQAYVVGVNRCGSDPNLHYNGRSVVVSPHGHIVTDAGEGEGVVTARLDLAGLQQWREEFPALADMRDLPPVPLESSSAS